MFQYVPFPLGVDLREVCTMVVHSDPGSDLLLTSETNDIISKLISLT